MSTPTKTNQTSRRAYTIIELLVGVCIVATFLGMVAIVWTLVHFISKFW